jgi:hypothetical protein
MIRSLVLLLLLFMLCFASSGCGYNPESFSQAIAVAKCERVFRCCDEAGRKAMATTFNSMDRCLDILQQRWKELADRYGDAFDYDKAALLLKHTKEDKCFSEDKASYDTRTHYQAWVTSSDYKDLKHLKEGEKCGATGTICRGALSCVAGTCQERENNSCEPV